MVGLIVAKIFSRREVNLNWVWLVEPLLKILATGLTITSDRCNSYRFVAEVATILYS